MQKRINILISGRVQGTFFRSTAKSVADKLGIVGFARNLPDGRVHIVAEGKKSDLYILLGWCHRGSFPARVDGLSFTWEKPSGAFEDFQIDQQGKTFIKDKADALVNLSKNIVGAGDPAIPRHVVVIPDGNRRWAEARRLPAWRGHKESIDRSVTLLREAKRIGIGYFTMWGFSTENWSRTASEVRKLMALFRGMIPKLKKEAFEQEVSVHHFGRKDRISKELSHELAKLEEETSRFLGHSFGLALDYGGRDEMLRAFAKLLRDEQPLTEENVALALDTNKFPDPDLIIRTGGEQRLSGMMPWQSAYAELYFTPLFFPDFGPAELRGAVSEFSSRSRRFGS
ncbi:MAG: di-trans,poly-cis-decaprenylcistransferase [Candidatus Liptonbacteria bacterium]|nr:di-trans,poly-cis-decaprenylcistransferase [Candidatus Liptonbacteria bacterium]